MILTYETFLYILERQKQLDKAFAKNSRWEPTFNDRCLALHLEKGEFINEFNQEVKWWKHKPNNLDNILSEGMDAWHFAAQLVYTEAIYVIKSGQQEHYKNAYNQIFGIIKNHRKQLAHVPSDQQARHLVELLAFANSWTNIIALITLILEGLGFDDEDMKEAYDQMNAKNYERIESGY